MDLLLWKMFHSIPQLKPHGRASISISVANEELDLFQEILSVIFSNINRETVQLFRFKGVKNSVSSKPDRKRLCKHMMDWTQP